MSREDQLLYMDASSMKSAKKDMLFYVKESAFYFASEETLMLVARKQSLRANILNSEKYSLNETLVAFFQLKKKRFS